MSKYHAQRCEVGGIKFDSKAEAKRWGELVLLQKAGYIRELRRQVPFELAPKVKFRGAKRATPALRYVADFCYTDAVTGERVVADVKGVQTQAWRIKKHLMLAVHGIEVREVRA